jgi:hypothetical protein
MEVCSLINIISHKILDIEKIKDNDNLLNYLVLDCETIEIEKNEIENDNCNNYKEIIIQIIESGNEYVLLHGFPGDSPKGCILLEDNNFAILGDEFIENNNNDLTIINIWYEQITEYSCNYENDYWY